MLRRYTERWPGAGKRVILELLSITMTFIVTLWHGIRRHLTKLFSLLGFVSIIFLTAQTTGTQSGLPASRFALSIIILTVVVSSILWFIPRRVYAAAFVNMFGWMPIFVGAASYYFWHWYAGRQHTVIKSEFFHASADVLPVLLLAAVIDVRRTRRLESKQLLLPIVGVFLGEIAALDALAFGHANPESFAVVASSLVSTTIALVLAVMADLSEKLSDDDGEDSDSQEVRNTHISAPKVIGPKEEERSEGEHAASPPDAAG